MVYSFTVDAEAEYPFLYFDKPKTDPDTIYRIRDVRPSIIHDIRRKAVEGITPRRYRMAKYLASADVIGYRKIIHSVKEEPAFDFRIVGVSSPEAMVSDRYEVGWLEAYLLSNNDFSRFFEAHGKNIGWKPFEVFMDIQERIDAAMSDYYGDDYSCDCYDIREATFRFPLFTVREVSTEHEGSGRVDLYIMHTSLEEAQNFETFVREIERM